MIRARIVGQARLGESLRRLRAAQTAALGDAVADGARQIQRAARQGLPRRSGNLANSITIETSPTGLAVSVGTDVDYGTYLELGTRRRAARPWLQPALLALRPSLRRGFARLVSAALQRAVRQSASGQP